MTYNACWYKALSASCAVHLVMALLLAMLIGNIDSSQQPEQHFVIELTEITGSDSQANVPEPMSVAAPISAALPIKVKPDRVSIKSAVTHSTISSPAGQAVVSGESPVSAMMTGGVAGGSSQASAAQPAAGLGSAGKAGNKPAGGQDIDGIINAFLARVEKAKEYPYMARKRGQVGTVTVAVRLTAAGDLAGVHVVRSSGVATLDEAALKLVQRVCPFAHNAGRVIAMNIPITYNLN